MQNTNFDYLLYTLEQAIERIAGETKINLSSDCSSSLIDANMHVTEYGLILPIKLGSLKYTAGDHLYKSLVVANSLEFQALKFLICSAISSHFYADNLLSWDFYILISGFDFSFNLTVFTHTTTWIGNKKVTLEAT